MTITKEAKLADLTPDARNANRGTERGSGMIERSLRSCGAGRSILLDKHGRIIAGNKTVENAGIIGLDDVLVVESDGTKLIAVQRVDLDLEHDSRARELALLDNRTAEVNLVWDAEVLDALSLEGVDLSSLFSESELEALIACAEGASPEAPEQFAAVDESISTDYCCPKCGFEWSGKAK
jgi:hypothetical protein